MAKRREAVLREARSVLRRVAKLEVAAEGIADEPSSELLAKISEDIEALVRHLVRLEGRIKRRVQRPR